MGFEIYLDESCTNESDPMFAVGGYIIDSDAAVAMDAEWRTVLAKYEIPHFHMVDCCHGNEAFEGMKVEQRDPIARHFIDLTKKYVTWGMAVGINRQRFDEDVAGADCYSFALRECATSLLGYSAGQNMNGHSVSKDISFFFEAGHTHKGLANAFFSEQMKKSVYPEYYRGHSFVPKEESPIVQAADILSYQFTLDIKRQYYKRQARRKDFISLLEIPTMFTHYTADHVGVIMNHDSDPLFDNPLRERLNLAIYGSGKEADEDLQRLRQIMCDWPAGNRPDSLPPLGPEHLFR